MEEHNYPEITAELLEQMRAVDPKTVDPSTLVDMKDVVVDTSLPGRERMLDYIRQIKNPYCYKDHGIIVKISFEGSRTIEDALSHYIRSHEQ